MVATRNHPKPFEDTPTDSPTRRSTRTSSANQSTPTPSTAASPSQSQSKPRSSGSRSGWSHTPSNLTLIWLAVSLPLVIWDTGFILLRPYTLPGGKLNFPIWAPYDLYGKVDYFYSTAAWEDHNGWTGAQGLVNAIETAAYIAYLYLVFAHGEQEPTQGRGAPAKDLMGRFKALSESRTVYGAPAAAAVLLGYSSALVTFAKTALYWLIDAFSGFTTVTHNSLFRLIFLWVIPNGAWLVFPAYLLYVFGGEILQGLELAAGKKSR